MSLTECIIGDGNASEPALKGYVIKFAAFQPGILGPLMSSVHSGILVIGFPTCGNVGACPRMKAIEQLWVREKKKKS